MQLSPPAQPRTQPAPHDGGGGAAAQFALYVDLLLTVGYIDGVFHHREREFVQRYLDSALALIERGGQGSPAERAQIRASWRAHFDELYARLNTEIAALAADVPAPGDGDFVPTRLKVRAVAIFRSFAPADQAVALELVQALMRSDGVVTPPEQRLYEELTTYFTAPGTGAATPAPATKPAAAPMIIGPRRWRELVAYAHPLLDPLEQTYSPHPVERQSQIAWDYQLVQYVIEQWNRQRAAGAGRLGGVTDVGQIPAGSRFLDGHVHVLRPDRPTELIVLGDLHGCYSCLKAALLQSNFIQRVWAHQWDPDRYPDVKLILLGDYIDRGRFSFDGVLRAVLQLRAAMPDHVFALRGNHEYFVWIENTMYSGVHPAEALASLTPVVPPEMLEAYRVLFESMPTSLLVDRTLYVHGGVPREDTLAERYRDLSSLNDPILRFQMMWSDPAATDHVPLELQRKNPRFAFGRDQFRAFMERAGLGVLVRGHEQVEHGFEVTYDLGDRLLLNLFSAGGHDNDDLPPGAPYRRVTPMALTVEHDQGPPRATPWPLQYRPFNYEPHNGLYRPQPLLEFRYT